MISVEEAKKIILEHTNTLAAITLPLEEAAGFVLAEDMFATKDIPAYAQSSMDGYAILFSDWKKNKSLKVEGEMAAGSREVLSLPPGVATRIFTGAPLPVGADTVVMQEKVTIEKDILYIEDQELIQGKNVRAKGSEIKPGELALTKGTLLLPAGIGFLAAIGITEVLVYPPPAVSIIVTGNELQQPGKGLAHGQVYESNSFALKAALKQIQITEVKIYHAEDILEKVEQVLNEALKQSDVVFLSGGVSVGDYDFVVKAAEQNAVEKLFHKIKQRPGKPLFFGKRKNKLVFGLPGNPSSVLTCFYEYVEPCLKKMMKQKTGLQVLKVPLGTDFNKTAGLTHFLKGYYDGKTVTPLNAQESYRLRSFATANCLIKIDEEITTCKKGESIEIHLLPA